MTNGLAAPNDGQATFIWTNVILNKQNTVTCGYRDLAATPSATVSAVSIYNLLAGVGCPCAANQMSTSWRFEGVKTIQLDSAGLPTAGSKLVAISGTLVPAVADSPVFTTLVVSKTTPYTGRQWRGRMYWPMTRLGEEKVDSGGSIETVGLATVRTQFSTLLTSWIGSNTPPYLFHVSDPHPSDPPAAINGLFVRPVVGIQRRRRVRGA